MQLHVIYRLHSVLDTNLNNIVLLAPLPYPRGILNASCRESYTERENFNVLFNYVSRHK